MQVVAECAELQNKVSVQQLNDQYDGERAALVVQLRAKLREATTARDLLQEQLVRHCIAHCVDIRRVLVRPGGEV